MEDPILADRVRGVRYSPKKYDSEDRVHADRKSAAVREEMKKEERKPSIEKEANASMSHSSNSMH
jgi:hypothetical protein